LIFARKGPGFLSGLLWLHKASARLQMAADGKMSVRLQARKAQEDLQAIQARKAPKARKVSKVFKALKALKAAKARQAQKDSAALSALLDQRGISALLAD
jgi:hypothetical protein